MLKRHGCGFTQAAISVWLIQLEAWAASVPGMPCKVMMFGCGIYSACLQVQRHV